MGINQTILEQFNEIKKRQKTAVFYKVDLHIHTPGSTKDYKVNGKFYEDVKLNELEDIATEKGLINIDGFRELYKNKDQLMALLIIHEAYMVKDLNMIVITDHNNLSWYDKIINAAEDYLKNIASRIVDKHKKFMILPGVEITCFSGTHVIGIFDNYEYKKVWDYVNFELNDMFEEKLNIFTTKSEIDVMKTINKVNGIVYVPHIDNNAAKIKISEMLDPLSGISKAQLLTSPLVNAIGFTNYKFKDYTESILQDRKHLYYRSSSVAYMKDSDAHCIEEIGTKFMYVKMDNPNFTSLKFALQDPKLRIKELDVSKNDIPYIRGAVTQGGYLSNTTEKYSYYPFSKDLNCIIGGRGVGKSTLIKCLKSCLTGNAPNYEFRLFMGQFQLILVYLHINELDYCICCEPDIKLSNYTGKEVNIHGDEVKGKITKIENWIKVYRIKNDKCTKLSEVDKYSLINKFHVDYFDQAQILEIGNNKDYLKEFIYSIIVKTKFSNEYTNLSKLLNECKKDFFRISDINNKRIIDFIVETKKKSKSITDQMDKIINNTINILNSAMKDKILINYDRIIYSTSELLGNTLEKYIFENRFNKYQLAKIERCINYISSRYDIIDVTSKFIENKKDIELEINESGVLNSQTVEEVENDSTRFDYYIDNICEICKDALKESFKNQEEVSIEFNVNSHEPKKNRLFRPLSVLSLGQKAVAVLTIITEGVASLDVKSPLVIDQPEDQLDNRFIYQHLIETIRKLKEKKQLILVTHNANIPVSGDAENVMCLNSNNENGWLEVYGYLDNKNIQKRIIDILEGGEDSFRLRLCKYGYVI